MVNQLDLEPALYTYFAEENQVDSNALLSFEKVVSISPKFF